MVDCYRVGGVAIRLVDASPADAVAVRGQLGVSQVTERSVPDLTLRFVDRIATSGPLRRIGDDVQFDAQTFCIAGSASGDVPRRVQIPFQSLGSECEVVCERGLRAIPLLVEMVNLTALAKGILPLHASAFAYQDSTTLVVGCADGGKTGTLLTFMAQGATFVADDWAYWDNHRGTLCGLSGRIRVRERYLSQLPGLVAKTTWRERQKLQILRAASAVLGGVFRAAPMAARVRSAVQRRRCIYASAERLFGDARLSSSEAPNKVFLIRHHDAPQVTVERLSTQSAVRGIAFVLDEEMMQLRDYYRKFLYAFPDAANPWLGTIGALLQDRLREALAGVESYEVCHPDPTPLSSLFTAMAPCFVHSTPPNL